MRAVPVVVRGFSFPSMSAAARALGVTPSRVITARKDGKLDVVGLNPGVACTWRGHPFSSLSACARHLGRSISAVHSAFHAGRLDRMEPKAQERRA